MRVLYRLWNDAARAFAPFEHRYQVVCVEVYEGDGFAMFDRAWNEIK